VLRWSTALAELARSSLAGSKAATLEGQRLALARSALSAARALKPDAGSAERADLLVLALSNARVAAVCLHAAEGAVSTSELVVESPQSKPSEALEPTLRAIVDRSVEDDVDAEPAQVQGDLELLLTHSQSLLLALEEPERRARRARQRAWARALAPLLALAVVLGFVGWRLFRAQELAAGKPWKTSSLAYVCDPAQKRCGDRDTGIFFHTQEDAEPWFEVDLGAVHELKRVELKNRSDCCQERAVPLVVEVSLDHQHYQMVARKFATFDHWSQSFPTTRGRYVRLRVARRSLLHLEQVQVYGRRL
jgi:hypothetical protein